MLIEYSASLMHGIVEWLLQPVIWALLGLMILAVWESGIAIGERWQGIRQLRARADTKAVLHLGRRRIERADLLTRIGPMLGLMGTLIPLGPGLAGLGQGELSILTGAIRVAFDTTVIGLLVGVVGFVLGRLRRRWYDQLLAELEPQS